MMTWRLAYRPRDHAIWAVEESKSRRVIGMINYHQRNLREKRVDVGWPIGPQHQGKGYALIRRVNKPSVALAKRLGFRREGGPIRDRWSVNGQWHSVVLYGLIAGEER